MADASFEKLDGSFIKKVGYFINIGDSFINADASSEKKQTKPFYEILCFL